MLKLIICMFVLNLLNCKKIHDRMYSGQRYQNMSICVPCSVLYTIVYDDIKPVPFVYDSSLKWWVKVFQDLFYQSLSV